MISLAGTFMLKKYVYKSITITQTNKKSIGQLNLRICIKQLKEKKKKKKSKNYNGNNQNQKTSVKI